MTGTPFGRYRLLDVLGRGGMGEVWRAHDTATDRLVAVKILPEHLARDHHFSERFRREAQVAAGLNHPHIIPIHNYGEIDGQLYVDMRLVDGCDLEKLLTAGPLPPERAVGIIEQIARALHAAHKVGLVHRDVKPSNVLLADDDFAYLIDFGIARRVTDGTSGVQSRITGTGNMIGTFDYIAPERLQGGDDDARADIYSLSCVLYEALTARKPFPGDSLQQQILAHLSQPAPRPSATNPRVTPMFDPVVARGMAKDPTARFATTVELATAARQALTAPISSAPVALPPNQLQQPYQPPSGPPPTVPRAKTNKLGIALIAASLAVSVVLIVFLSTRGSSDSSSSSSAGTTRSAADRTAATTTVAATPFSTAPTTTAPTTTIPTTTTTRTSVLIPEDGPTPAGQACGTISGSSFVVEIINGTLTCDEALTVMDTYRNDPTVEKGGNWMVAAFDGWECWSPTAATSDIQQVVSRCDRGSTDTVVMR